MEKLSDISWRKAISIAVVLVIMGFVFGFPLGLLIALVSPDFFPALFGFPGDPVSLGLGTGAANGVGVGTALAAAFLIACGIAQRKKQPLMPTDSPYAQYPRDPEN